MLAVERKKTDKVDWVKPLDQFIRNQYNSGTATEYRDAISAVSQLREDCRNNSQTNDTAKELYLKYYTLLQAIDVRFPIGENNLRVSFVWYDILKSKKTASFSVHLEKCSILFNIGSILSQIGALQNRSSVDGLKTACQNFQAAAGAFQLLKDEIEKHPQPNILDMTPEFVSCLINLMLAQAQECFLEKAIKDSMKAAIVSKLAAQAAEFYDTATNFLNATAVAPIAPKNWTIHTQLKSLMYKAAAQYRASIAHGEADEYGAQVARLQLANKLMEDAKKKYVKSLPNDVQQAFTSMHTQISAALTKYEKENDTIYHDTVPSEGKLTPIEKKAIVKPTPLQDSLPQTTDPFGKLIPFAVTQKLSVYQERKDSIVRNEIRSIDEQNQLAIASLSSMNLPGAIEALETPGDAIPQSLVEKMNVVKSEGGARMILELMETLNKLAEEDSSILGRVVVKLDNEEKEDNEMRQHYGSRWQRTPSHTLTVNLRQEGAKYKGNIEHARKSDAYVAKKFQDQQQYVVKLSSTVDDVKAMLPANSSTAGANSKTVMDLKQSLTLLDKLIAERAAARNELSALSQNDDIAPKLMNTTKTDEEVFAEELNKYNSIQSKLQGSYTEQANLLTQIQQQNAEFVAKKQSNNSNAQREQVLQQLNTAFKIYNELKNNLREGIQFYTNFQDLLKQFSVKCEDFVFARQTEKQDLLNDIQRQTTGVQMNNEQQYPMSSKPLPPLPPQPQHQLPSQPQQPAPTMGYQTPVNPYSYQYTTPTQPAIPGSWQPNMKPVYQSAPQPYGNPTPMYNPQPQPYGMPQQQQQPPPPGFAQQPPFYYNPFAPPQQPQPPNQQQKR